MRKEMTSKSKNTMKTIGLILEVLAIPLMIVNIVLLKMPNTDLGTSTVLLIVSNFALIIGLMLSHLPKQSEKEEKKEDSEKVTNSLFLWI